MAPVVLHFGRTVLAPRAAGLRAVRARPRISPLADSPEGRPRTRRRPRCRSRTGCDPGAAARTPPDRSVLLPALLVVRTEVAEHAGPVCVLLVQLVHTTVCGSCVLP